MPAPPYSCGNRDAQQPETGHPAEHAVAIEPVLPIGFPDVRRDLARGPFPDGALQLLLFVGEVEADHREPEMVSRDAAPGFKSLSLTSALSATNVAVAHSLQAPDAYGGAAPRTGLGCGTCAVCGDFQVIRAAEQRAQLARRRLGIVGNDRRNLERADADDQSDGRRPAARRAGDRCS
jgi:hypothetical protein